MGHDIFGNGYPGHDRQHHVQGDDVGAKLPAKLDRVLAVTGLSDNFELWVHREDFDQVSTDCDGVFDDEDTNSCHA